jgi:glycosyltransferase involved in cell wall biosynthesis
VRNEAGNIQAVVERMPELGLGTEIIFVEGHSQDNTWSEIQRVKSAYAQRAIKVLKQQSAGKGGAVREGFAAATGEVLFILDGDLTVPPEDLPKFYDVVRSGVADFVNGGRLVYPLADEAMRFLNMVANKFFALAFSWMLGQPLKDTLCGTKVLFRTHYDLIAKNRAYFGDFDPFGDFDLLFGAAKLNLRISELPIRYQARTYGQTNIQRWRHGWLLLRMLCFAARRLKFLA